MSLLTARVYRDTNATKTFSRYTVFCLLSRTAFEILHYLLPTSCLFIITGWIMLQLASLVFYHSMSFMVKALSWHQPSNKLIWLNHDASLFTSSINHIFAWRENTTADIKMSVVYFYVKPEFPLLWGYRDKSLHYEVHSQVEIAL